MSAPGGLVDRALGPDWAAWRRKLPSHLRVTLPVRPPGGLLGKQLAQMALRKRRAWIAEGKPERTAQASERDWLLLLKLNVPGVEAPPPAPRDKQIGELTTQMLDAAPGSPLPTCSGIPLETIRELMRGSTEAVPARATPARGSETRVPRLRQIRRSGGGHGVRHNDDFKHFDIWWMEKGVDRSTSPVEQRAVIAAWHIADSFNRKTSRSRGNAILAARDYLTMLGLPGSELAIWLRNTITAAKKGGGGRRTVAGTVELLLDASRRSSLAVAVEKSGDALLAQRIRGERSNPFQIGSDPARGFYYYFNVIGAHVLVKDQRPANGVVLFWSDYISKVAQ